MRIEVAGYLLRVEKRAGTRWWHAALASLLAIVASLFLLGFAFLQAGADPGQVYFEIARYAFLSEFGLPQTVNRGVFILLCAFAFIVPMRAGLWNIGLPGQVYAGALAVFGVVHLFGGNADLNAPLPGWLVIPLMLLAAAAGGGLYGAVAGFLRGRFEVNEIVTTMMMNWIMLWLVAHMIREGGPFMGRTAEGEGFSLPLSVRLPQVATVPLTAYGALLLAAVLVVFLNKTTLGYQIRVMGHSPAAARYAGIDTLFVSTLVFGLGGLFAGLAGYHYFAAVPGVYKIPKSYSDFGDFSFYGLITGLIARNHPVAAIPVALLFGGLASGARFMQGKLQLTFGIDYALLGVLMMTMVAFQALVGYRLLVERTLAPVTVAVEREDSRVESPRH